MEVKVTRFDNELMHHGVKGMKWGVRRYQNSDGSLTPAGEKRYGGSEVGRAKLAVKVAKKDYNKAYNEAYKYSRNHPIGQWTNKKKSAEADKRWGDAADKAETLRKAKDDYKQAKKDDKASNKNTDNKGTREKMVKAAKVGAKVAGNMAMYSLVDDIFYNGAGKKVAKAATKAAGRAATEAYLRRHGSIDITWLD